MRIIVFFDLPVLTASERRHYAKFRKFLIKSGFIMMQESVYSKLCLNSTVSKSVSDNVRKNKPQKGLIELLIVTEKQFASIEYVLGEKNDEYINSTDRLVIL